MSWQRSLSKHDLTNKQGTKGTTRQGYEGMSEESGKSSQVDHGVSRS
jgi:hypothetical protein